MAKIHLHMHSNYSDDGEFSPAELLYIGWNVQHNVWGVSAIQDAAGKLDE